MIRVTIYKTSDSFKGYTVSGHAGYADSGSDIICAAVSALVINTANSIEAFTGSDISVNENEEEGIIELIFNKAPGPEAILLMRSMILGLEDIRSGSEEYMQISYKEDQSHVKNEYPVFRS